MAVSFGGGRFSFGQSDEQAYRPFWACKFPIFVHKPNQSQNVRICDDKERAQKQQNKSITIKVESKEKDTEIQQKEIKRIRTN